MVAVEVWLGRVRVLNVLPLLIRIDLEPSGPLGPLGQKQGHEEGAYTGEQIAFALKHSKTGTPVVKLIRQISGGADVLPLQDGVGGERDVVGCRRGQDRRRANAGCSTSA